MLVLVDKTLVLVLECADAAVLVCIRASARSRLWQPPTAVTEADEARRLRASLGIRVAEIKARLDAKVSATEASNIREELAVLQIQFVELSEP